jgi:hypothetical protein
MSQAGDSWILSSYPPCLFFLGPGAYPWKYFEVTDAHIILRQKLSILHKFPFPHSSLQEGMRGKFSIGKFVV